MNRALMAPVRAGFGSWARVCFSSTDIKGVDGDRAGIESHIGQCISVAILFAAHMLDREEES